MIEYRRSNRECPECGNRLEAKPRVDYLSEYRCPECGWSRTFDPRMGESADAELDWYNPG